MGSYLDIGLLVEQALGCCRRGERKRKHQHAGIGATVNITGALMVLGQTCHITVKASWGNPPRPTSRGLNAAETLREERTYTHESWAEVCGVLANARRGPQWNLGELITPCDRNVPSGSEGLVTTMHTQGDALVHMQKSANTQTVT